MDGRTRTKPLVEGALLAAIAVVLVMLGMYVPILGSVVVFLWPVPVVVIYLRHGPRTALLTIAVAGLALAALFGPLQAVLTVITFGTLGLAFGFGLSRRWGGSAILFLGAGAALCSLLVTVAASSLLMNINVFATLFTSMRESIRIANEMYSRIGLGEEAAAMLNMFSEALPAMQLILPAVVVAASLVNATINYQVSRGVLRRLGYHVPDLPPFVQWRLPAGSVLVYAGLLTAMFVGQVYGWGTIVNRILTNATFFLSMAFNVHGLALAYWLMSRWELAKWFRIVASVIILFSPTLLLVVQWAGIVDAIIDFRRMLTDRGPRPPRAEEEQP